VVVNENNAILFIRATSIEVPTGGDRLFMEGAEEGLFDIVRDGHVIFDGIKAAEDDVEYAYLISRVSKGVGGDGQECRLTIRARSPSNCFMTPEKLRLL
jgi:hypothetical protein